MSKNKKVLIILAVAISLLCVVGGVAMVVMKPNLDTDVLDEQVENQEIKDILIQAGYGERINNLLMSFIKTPVNYDVTINGKKYRDLAVVTLLLYDSLAPRNSEYFEEPRDLVIVLMDMKENKVVQQAMFTTFLSDDACKTYSELDIRLNPQYSLNQKNELSFYIVSNTLCGTKLGAGILSFYTFFNVDSNGIIKQVYRDVLGSDFNISDGGSGDRHSVKTLNKIAFQKNNKNDYNDIVLSIEFSLEGTEEIFDQFRFMESAFNSTESNWSVNSNIRNLGDGVSLSSCPKLVERVETILSFKSDKYEVIKGSLDEPISFNNYCFNKVEDLNDLKVVLDKLGLKEEDKTYKIYRNSATSQYVHSIDDKNISLYIIPVSKDIDSDKGKKVVYDIYYAFVRDEDNKLLKSIIKRDAYESPTTKSSEGHYSPTKYLERVLVNMNYMNDMSSSEEYYDRVGRQRIYFSGDNETVYDNLIYITEDYEIIDLIEPYKGVFKSGEDELINFGQLEEGNGLYYLKYPTKEGKEVKRPILRPDLMVKKGN